MLRTTIRNLMARKIRLVTTGIAVLLGVAFMSGSLTLTATITHTFDNLFVDVFAGTDAYVRGQEAFDASGPGNFGAVTRPRVDASLVSTVAAVPGVKAAEGNLTGYAQIVGKNGKAVGKPGNGPPTFGGNWPKVAAFNAYHLVAGHAPEADDQIVIDAGSADKGDYAAGDTATVLTKAGPIQAQVVGVAKFGEVDSALGSTFVFFTDRAAQRYLATPGKYDGISVVAEHGMSESAVAERIRAALPTGTEVVTGARMTKENQDDVAQALSFFGTFMNIFSIIALFVGSFIIYNTFSILVAQRSREMALLRAIGASRRQVTNSVLLEAFVVGTLAAVLGLGAGIGVAAGLKALLDVIGFDIPATGMVLTGNTVIVSLVVGIVISLVAAWFPARRAAKVAPIAAMRDVAVERADRSRLRIGLGGLVTALGVLALLGGLFGDVSNPLRLVGLGALLTMVGVAALGALFARPVTRLLGAPLERLRGVTGHLARENAMRNPRRTSTTASALMIGVALVGFITIFASSAKASLNKTFDDQFTGDFVVDSGTFGFGGLSPELATRLRDTPQVAAVSSHRITSVELDGAVTQLNGFDPVGLERIADIGIVQGKAADLDATGLAVQEKKAKDKHWTIGSKVPVTFAETGTRELTVRAIYRDHSVAGQPGLNEFVGLAVFERNVPDAFDSQVYATLAPGVSVTQGRAAIEAVTANYPNAKVQDREQYKKAQTAQINPLLALIYVLLLLAVIIALLGIANTLGLSIVERTRELGLLRAVGMTRRQMRSMIRWESVLIALFGTLGGLGVGLFFGWALVHALADQGFNVFRIPVVSLAVISILAALVGVVAAAVPARRAARLDVLRAIATE